MVEDMLPADELLTDNIILSIAAESGWVELDISEYQIVLDGEIAVSLEWLKESSPSIYLSFLR